MKRADRITRKTVEGCAAEMYETQPRPETEKAEAWRYFRSVKTEGHRPHWGGWYERDPRKEGATAEDMKAMRKGRIVMDMAESVAYVAIPTTGHFLKPLRPGLLLAGL